MVRKLCLLPYLWRRGRRGWGWGPLILWRRLVKQD
jgi:hypothetical protein